MVFFKPWQNALGQLSVLNEISNSSPSVLNLNDGMFRSVIQNTDLEYLTEKSKASAMRCMSQQCNCLDLLQAIIALVDTPAEANVNVLLNRLIQKEPELICVGLASFQVTFRRFYGHGKYCFFNPLFYSRCRTRIS
jgi:hypothetical protein